MAARIVDLTHTMYDRMPTFPGDPDFSLTPYHTIESIGYNLLQVTMPSHCGTHLDAPSHFVAGARTTERIELGRCIGEAHLLDLTHRGPGEEITLDDLAPYDAQIQKGARLVIRTGWERVFPEPRFFTEFPGISIPVARLLAERQIALLGLDMPSVHTSEFKLVHEILLGAEIVIVESLTNLGELPPTFYFIALPLKFAGGDGSPVRAIAITGDAKLG